MYYLLLPDVTAGANIQVVFFFTQNLLFSESIDFFVQKVSFEFSSHFSLYMRVLPRVKRDYECSWSPVRMDLSVTTFY